MTSPDKASNPPARRPMGLPQEGEIEAFDAGWNASEAGLDRQTVAVLTPPSGRGWALLGWDARETIQRRTTT